MDFIETEIGPIYLKGFGQDENWLDSTDGFALYLEGLPVFESSRDHSWATLCTWIPPGFTPACRTATG